MCTANSSMSSAKSHGFKVLFGKGPEVHENPGNRRFRSIVASFAKDYHQLSNRKSKTRIVSSILEQIRKEGGNFFKRESSGLVLVTDERQCKGKIGHALRDLRGDSPKPARPMSSAAATLSIPAVYLQPPKADGKRPSFALSGQPLKRMKPSPLAVEEQSSASSHHGSPMHQGMDHQQPVPLISLHDMMKQDIQQNEQRARLLFGLYERPAALRSVQAPMPAPAAGSPRGQGSSLASQMISVPVNFGETTTTNNNPRRTRTSSHGRTRKEEKLVDLNADTADFEAQVAAAIDGPSFVPQDPISSSASAFSTDLRRLAVIAAEPDEVEVLGTSSIPHLKRCDSWTTDTLDGINSVVSLEDGDEGATDEDSFFGTTPPSIKDTMEYLEQALSVSKSDNHDLVEFQAEDFDRSFALEHFFQ